MYNYTDTADLSEIEQFFVAGAACIRSPARAGA